MAKCFELFPNKNVISDTCCDFCLFLDLQTFIFVQVKHGSRLRSQTIGEMTQMFSYSPSTACFIHTDAQEHVNTLKAAESLCEH